MKAIVDSPTGWMAYVRAFQVANPTAIIDYKALLQQYIRRK